MHKLIIATNPQQFPSPNRTMPSPRWQSLQNRYIVLAVDKQIAANLIIAETKHCDAHP